MNIRKRDKINNEEFSIETTTDLNSIKSDKNLLKSFYKLKTQKNFNKVNLSLIYWLFLFIFLFILFNFAIRFQSSCEFKKDFIDFNLIKNEKIDNFEPTFNDSIARFHLQSIIKLGRRPTGSAANEVHIVNYIVKYIQNIVNQYSMIINSNLIVTIDEHVSKLNSFPLIVFGTQHMSSIYDRLRSVVVRIHDKNSDITEAALMINCHYDSFFGGLGASDDLTSCVVMLETLHSLLKYQPISLRSDIILLFNGAEENFLQASHAFVTQHKWAKHVKLFINLEAAGSGGRQMIFQASQQHPWIVDELAQILRQPFASVIGQEIFSANLIPSDTDYRIFRDFGNIPGVDFAFITNGYIYHTSYDTEDRIPQTCLRHTGDNLLKIVLHLANIDFVAGKQSSEDTILSSQRVIFFDFLGFVLISYTEFTGICLNVVFIFISILIVAYHVVRRPGYLKQLLITIISQILWAFSNFLLSLLLGYLLHRFGCKMSWYSLRYNVIGLFVAPLLGYYFIYHLHLSHYLFRIPATTSSSELHRHSCLIIISIFTITLTFFRLLSCYFIAMWLIFCFLNEFLSNILQSFNISEFYTNVLNIVREALSFTLPMTYYFYMSYTLYDVFIPILGRSGPGYADMVISGLTGLTFVVPGWLFASSVYITSISNKKWIIFILIHFSISYYIFINSTQFGFPYNQSEINPRKQRIFINHVTRNIRNSRGQTQISDSGLWILSLDTNNVAFVKERLEQALNVPMNDIYCELRPYCGYPLLFPFANVIDKSLWIPQPPHKLTPAASILVLNKVTHMSGMVNVTMQVDGPPHSPIYIMTPESMRVLSWSLSADPPQPIDMPSYADKNYRHYFIFYGYGDKPLTPLTFWITFLPKISGIHKKPKDEFENQIEIAVAAHYLLAKTEQIEGLLHLMPKWTVPTFLASSYDHIVVDFEEHLSFNQ